MIKGVFISQWGTDKKGKNSGNIKKVEEEIACFRANGFDIKTVFTEPYDFSNIPYILNRIISKALNAGPFLSCNRTISYRMVGKADFYYIRFRNYDYYFRKLLKDIRRNNPDSLILLEYSDYPYLFLKWKDVIGDFGIYLKDIMGRRVAKKTVDRIVTLLDEPIIDQINTLKFYNGINVDKIPIRSWKKNNTIRIIAVASFQECHGIDRLIKGLIHYYNSGKQEKRDCILHIVGGGSPVEKCRELATPIKDKIIFHGYLFGKELDKIYDSVDIGTEFLAPARKKIVVSSSLKSREYISRGLPFVTACKLDIDKDNQLPFVLKLADDELPINIQQVIEFYDEFYGNEDLVFSKIRAMRKFAEDNLTMDGAMKNVLGFINTECKMAEDARSTINQKE